MAKLKFSLACGDYDRTRALQDGRVTVDGVDLNYITLTGGAPEIFWRMFRHEEFDASEISMSGYISEVARGVRRFVAIPVFPSRTFRHSTVYIRTDAIRDPGDLRGKEIGVPDYNMTAAVWVRGLLHHEYGVKPSDVVWRTGGQDQPGRQERVELNLPPHIQVKPIPETQTLSAMLMRGEIAALITPYLLSSAIKSHPKVKPLFPDYRRAEEDYFRKTRIFPIMHAVAIKESVYRENPWVAMNLYKAFRAAKDWCFREMANTGTLRVSLPWLIPELEREREVLGEDLWPYGLDANRHVIETLIRYCCEQGLIERVVPVEDLFAKETLSEFKI